MSSLARTAADIRSAMYTRRAAGAAGLEAYWSFDEAQGSIDLLIHWTGGCHSELHVKRNPTGRHGRSTSLEAIDVVRQMATTFSDEQIAVTLNRLGLRTGPGNTWTEGRVRSARDTHGISACDLSKPREHLTLEAAAHHLGVAGRGHRDHVDGAALGPQALEQAQAVAVG